MIRAVLLFLLVILILAVAGKWLRLPPGRRRRPLEDALRCPTCRSYVVGRQPSACDRADCPYG